MTRACFGLVTTPWTKALRASVPAILVAIPAIWVSSLNGIPYLILLLAVLLVVAEVVMRRTAFGARLYAIGGNPEAARLAGINSGRTIFWDFLLAGFMYGVIGVALTARINGAVAGAPGSCSVRSHYAAVVGGTSLFGGRGTIIGALLGSLLVGGLANGMSLLNVPLFYQQITKGVVLLLVVAADFVGRRND